MLRNRPRNLNVDGGFNKIKHFIGNPVNSTFKSQLQIANKYVQFVKEYDTDPNGERGGVPIKTLM